MLSFSLFAWSIVFSFKLLFFKLLKTYYLRDSFCSIIILITEPDFKLTNALETVVPVV